MTDKQTNTQAKQFKKKIKKYMPLVNESMNHTGLLSKCNVKKV